MFVFLVWLTEESLLAESFPLQNDGNQNTTEPKVSKDQVKVYLHLFLGLFWRKFSVSLTDLPPLLCFQDVLSDEEKLAGAALHLKNVGDISVPVILNIIGNN